MIDRTAARRSPADSINAYIAAFPAGTQAMLQELRAVIRAAAPDAVETMSYAIPTFDLNGRHRVHFAGCKTAKGSVQFPLDRPLPMELIARMVAFRVQEVSRAGRPAGG